MSTSPRLPWIDVTGDLIAAIPHITGRTPVDETVVIGYHDGQLTEFSDPPEINHAFLVQYDQPADANAAWLIDHALTADLGVTVWGALRVTDDTWRYFTPDTGQVHGPIHPVRRIDAADAEAIGLSGLWRDDDIAARLAPVAQTHQATSSRDIGQYTDTGIDELMHQVLNSQTTPPDPVDLATIGTLLTDAATGTGTRALAVTALGTQWPVPQALALWTWASAHLPQSTRWAAAGQAALAAWELDHPRAAAAAAACSLAIRDDDANALAGMVGYFVSCGITVEDVHYGLYGGTPTAALHRFTQRDFTD